MIIETKFNIGDRAWFMKNNKVTEVIISSISLSYVDSDSDNIIYTANDAANPTHWLDHVDIEEKTLFKSKQELLDSL